MAIGCHDLEISRRKIKLIDSYSPELEAKEIGHGLFGFVLFGGNSKSHPSGTKLKRVDPSELHSFLRFFLDFSHLSHLSRLRCLLGASTP